jgi:Putative peptidoglycan binding domain
MPTKKVRILSAAMAGGLVVTGVTAAAITAGHTPARAALAANMASSPPVNLDNCPMLSEGYQDVGCVSQLQTELNTILGLNLSVDGTFGAVTKTAVERFQQEHNIVPADGIVGPQTKAALDNPGSSSAGTPPGQLNPGQQITSGTQIASPDGKYALQMQSDGNLVLRAPGNIPIGDTRTAGNGGAIAVMQTDGNFVLRAPGNIPVWASGTDGHPGTVLQVQDDGNVVLYAPGHQALRVLFPAAPGPQNSVPTPTVPPATAPATTPGTPYGSGGANTAPTNTVPGTTSGPNSGKASFRKCDWWTCSIYYSHQATVQLADKLDQSGFTGTVNNVAAACTVASLPAPVLLPGCVPLFFTAIAAQNVKDIIDHAAATAGCVRFRSLDGINDGPSAVYADHSATCHSMDP